MVYSPLDTQQYLRFAGGRAIENMKGTLRHYGYSRDMHSIVEDVETNLVFPLNRILERHQLISSHYEMYFKMLLNSLIFIAIITLGCGLVFFPCLLLIQYLHWKHVKNYDKNVKERIHRILERENKKYLPYGFEWIIKYSIINSDKKRTCVGIRTELACVQEVVLSLIHVRSNPFSSKIGSPPLSSFSSVISSSSSIVKETPSSINGNPALSEETTPSTSNQL
ncbi:predicted protein [Naegleria gruberi]|uniref:Predicted protein n=1 Tax=Naegleria gruberi TaxID=5762 RepID=D2VYH0_NAEGR|nr:uncharacterized protein NAEGRDRAFT_74117 [Naegleria gruberi]EFC38058.1 predicted protein [Naegleria gruberi]|eukprot:XP_002670802.1 predicted protein [Naegleria gruberi strain NEG-M]